jgi:ribonuclease T2
MVGHRVRQSVHVAATVASLILVLAVTAFAADGERSPPGQFDYYVLALSWSPSYCESSKERAPARKPTLQCSGRPFAFVVHGLWPQYTQGFPSYCQVPAPRVERRLVDAMLDLMPSRRLVYYEWDRHGTCSGLNPQGYFDTLRKAREAVTIPLAYRAPAESLTVSPADITAAFIAANPGLSTSAITIACNKTRLMEVRLCLNKDLSFHDCGAIARRACWRDAVVMPAVRAHGAEK